ncbi:MAG: YebC/PmpR family DNA-binding transcriptional regulator [Flavobacteriales bacterium]|nr:YebC/PmpR family DNA-binding transcriptional regulator [Flavobacteriales bacterium]|tara:strand:+ start:269 stop:1021 length:753 start_codon:yes stop_codon:yes gene_type:complete
MAGHSKWANIKHRKGAQDAKRGKVFTKIIKEISVAVKEGGNDPESNPRLRTAIQNAKGVNMPRENVERAIKKASGSDAESYMEVTYEGYGPYGIAIFIECTTDNINRTVADVRAIFNKYNGELGKNGSLEFLFEKKGVFIIEKSALNLDLEELEMELIDFGLEEFEIHDEICNILCDFDKFGVMQEKLTSMSIDVKSAEVERIPNELKDLDLDQALKIFNIVEKFEENDDVQKVFHNLHVSDNIIKELDK